MLGAPWARVLHMETCTSPWATITPGIRLGLKRIKFCGQRKCSTSGHGPRYCLSVRRELPGPSEMEPIALRIEELRRVDFQGPFAKRAFNEIAGAGAYRAADVTYSGDSSAILHQDPLASDSDSIGHLLA